MPGSSTSKKRQFRVASARGPDGGVEYQSLYVGRDRVRFDPTHGPGCIKRFVEVHERMLPYLRHREG